MIECHPTRDCHNAVSSEHRYVLTQSWRMAEKILSCRGIHLGQPEIGILMRQIYYSSCDLLARIGRMRDSDPPPQRVRAWITVSGPQLHIRQPYRRPLSEFRLDATDPQI